MKHLIFDYETLSTDNARCPIVALALIIFDDQVFFSEEPYTMDGLREAAQFYKFDIADQVTNYDRRPSRETIRWWQDNVDKETQKWLLTPTKADISISRIPDIFNNALRETEASRKCFVVCRALTFDVFITHALCDQLEVDVPWAFWQERDSRSLIDGVMWQTDLDNNFMPKGIEDFRAHNPIDDIAVDVLRLQLSQRTLLGMD